MPTPSIERIFFYRISFLCTNTQVSYSGICDQNVKQLIGQVCRVPFILISSQTRKIQHKTSKTTKTNIR